MVRGEPVQGLNRVGNQEHRDLGRRGGIRATLGEDQARSGFRGVSGEAMPVHPLALQAQKGLTRQQRAAVDAHPPAGRRGVVIGGHQPPAGGEGGDTVEVVDAHAMRFPRDEDGMGES